MSKLLNIVNIAFEKSLHSLLNKHFSFVVLITTIIIALIAFAGFRNLKFDYNFERYFPVNDEDLEFYVDFRKQFETDNDFLLIALKSVKSVFNKQFLSKVDSFCSRVQQMNYVESVIVPTRFKNTIIGPFGPIEVPLLHFSDSIKLILDSVRLGQEPDLHKNFFSKDGEWICIHIKNSELLAKKKSDSLLFNIEETLIRFKFDDYKIAGRIHGQHYYIKKIQSQMTLYILLSFLLTVIFLLITYKAAWAVFLPVSVIVISAVWLFGTMGWAGKGIDIIKTLIPTILFVVGMSDVIHILSRYIEELRNGNEKKEALKITLNEIGLATLLTSLTTAIGFITLTNSKIEPVAEFGLFMALGVMLAFVSAFAIMSSALYIMKKPVIVSNYSNKKKWNYLLGAVMLFSVKKRKKVLFFFLLFVALALYGISLIKNNNFLLEDLPENDPIRQPYTFFENEFNGNRPLEIAIEILDTSETLLSYSALNEINKIEKFIAQNYNAGMIISPLTPVKILNRAINGGLSEKHCFPENEQMFEQIKLYIEKQLKRKEFRYIISDDKKKGRIQAKMIDYGGAETRKLDKQFNYFVAENIDTSKLKIKITGTAYLIDKNNEYLAGNMLQGLLIAVIIIALIAGLMFRSVRMIIIALIPNVIPLLLIGGFMGFSGINLKVSTSVIFTIAFGIAVDDTIHFLSKFRLEINKEKSLLYALKRTYLSTGKAIILTTLVLSGGFITLISASFMSIYYIGLLISLTLVFALVADLVLLPALIIMFYRVKRKG